jgi:twitching motility protein PilT
MTQVIQLSPKARPLSDLDFMDIYVRLDSDASAHYRPSPNMPTNGRTAHIAQEVPDADLPDEFAADAAALAEHLREAFTDVEISLSFGGMRMRATRLETAKNEIWAACRRLPPQPLGLEKLGFISQLPPLLESLGRRSGLTLICGASGQGKTTTASSLFTRFLESFGGVGFTLEDPVEYDMEGRIGKSGYCYQTEIREEEEWGQMLKRSLRWHPRYILVGEIRTPDAANHLLRAATSGHNVIATMHSGSMEEALEGLLHLAGHAVGDRAPLVLAAGLSAVIHQSFTPSGLFAQFMMTEADNPGSPVRSLIRDRRIGQTRTFADQQMARLLQHGRIFDGRDPAQVTSINKR